MAMTAERKAERAADRKRERELNKLTPISDKVTVTKSEMNGYEHLYFVSVKFEGCVLEGEIAQVNVRLEQMGYRPVRITRNMLNPDSGFFAIDINTPAYCDPGCESYHTM